MARGPKGRGGAQRKKWKNVESKWRLRRGIRTEGGRTNGFHAVRYGSRRRRRQALECRKPNARFIPGIITRRWGPADTRREGCVERWPTFKAAASCNGVSSQKSLHESISFVIINIFARNLGGPPLPRLPPACPLPLNTLTNVIIYYFFISLLFFII